MKILVTGGAGFIGSNLAYHFITAGHDLTVFDSLSRRGSARNLDWLQQNSSGGVRFVRGDIREPAAVNAVVAGQDAIFHCAAQVAVTASLLDPRTDFEINALGTLNLLEAVRLGGRQPAVFFTSTNKVYGGLEDVEIVEKATRYELPAFPNGIDESRQLDFHSPYGCSKGTADQYVRDYGRIYQFPTVVFRMSCIYGTRQFGVEDQGWVAHFAIAAKRGLPITIFGDGKQVRDLLYIDDLIDAFDRALQNIQTTAGKIYNIGGGAANTISVWTEFGPLLEGLTTRDIQVSYQPWRRGDQLVYVSNHTKATREMGWRPVHEVKDGVRCLLDWIDQNPADFAPVKENTTRQ